MSNLISPSFNILKSWQGIAEMALRVACVVLSFILLICAAVAVNAINNISDIADEDDFVNSRAGDNLGRYRSAAVLVILVAIIGMIIEPLIIVIRILNISIVNNNFIISGIIDIAISAAFAFFLFAGGIANAVYSSYTSDNHDDLCRFNNLNGNQEDACDYLSTASSSEGATAAFSFFALIAYGALGGIILFVLITQHFNKPKSSGDQYQEPSDPNQAPAS